MFRFQLLFCSPSFVNPCAVIFLTYSVRTWNFYKKRKHLYLLTSKISADPSHSVGIQTIFFQFSNFLCLGCVVSLLHSHTLHWMRTRAVCPTLFSSMLAQETRPHSEVCEYAQKYVDKFYDCLSHNVNHIAETPSDES